MITCPTCKRLLSERTDPRDSLPDRCEDPLHALADQLVDELRDYCTEHGIAWTQDSVLGAVKLYDEERRLKKK